MERILDEENDCDHNVEGDSVEGPVVCVSREEVLQALNEMQTGKALARSDVPLEQVVASGVIGIQMMAELCQSPCSIWNASLNGLQAQWLQSSRGRVIPRESFDRVPSRMLEWAMRKKGIPEVLVRSVMSLYKAAKTRVRVDYELSEEFEVKVGMHQGSVLSHLLSAVVVDVVAEFA